MRVRQRKAGESKDQVYFTNLVTENAQKPVVLMHGIARDDVKNALSLIDRRSDHLVDVVCALLDDQLPNLFNSELPFSAGASTSHLACYVGIYLRHGKKLDREGRDYWIKPLREVGVIEPVTYDKISKDFQLGHLKAKSPLSSYRLASSFIDVLKSKSGAQITKYFGSNEIGVRLMIQSRAVEYIANTSGKGDHSKLIQLAQDFYVPKFLPDFKVLYVDDSDGDRISNNEQINLKEFGISLTIDDVFPDILLGNLNGELWFIEAVTSDGEVDETKMINLRGFCKKHGKKLAGATTCYLSWKALASRQSAHKNLAAQSYLWIAEDPSKHFKSTLNKD